MKGGLRDTAERRTMAEAIGLRTPKGLITDARLATMAAHAQRAGDSPMTREVAMAQMMRKPRRG